VAGIRRPPGVSLWPGRLNSAQLRSYILTSSNSLQTKSVLIDKTERPELINAWLKGGRKFQAMPIIGMSDAGTFGDFWMKWWAHLQPDWRGDGPVLSRDAPEGADWTELQKGGPNGFFLVLLSYCWWGSAAIDDDSDEIQPTYSKWIEMFEDMEWVLECMVHDLECSVERLEEQNGEDADESDHESGPVAKRFVCF
jgi:hypothetical protein